MSLGRVNVAKKNNFRFREINMLARYVFEMIKNVNYSGGIHSCSSGK